MKEKQILILFDIFISSRRDVRIVQRRPLWRKQLTDGARGCDHYDACQLSVDDYFIKEQIVSNLFMNEESSAPPRVVSHSETMEQWEGRVWS